MIIILSGGPYSGQKRRVYEGNKYSIIDTLNIEHEYKQSATPDVFEYVGSTQLSTECAVDQHR